MCALMEPGQLDKLLSEFGNYVDNYIVEILMKGILRQSTVTTTLSGMQLHAPQTYALLRFKQLLRFDLPQLHDKIFQIQWTFPDTWTTDDLHPIHFLSTTDAIKKNFHYDYECWALSWIGIRITFEQILDPSYGPVLQDIINDIKLNNVGQLFDIEYIVTLTIRMFALLSQYSSQHVSFHIIGAILEFDPATMVTSDWYTTIHYLWHALKSFLTFPLQHEFNIINEKFKVVKMKPLLPKDKKPPVQNKEKHPIAVKSAMRSSSQSTTCANVKTKVNRVTPHSGKPVDRVVEFADKAGNYCIKDFARHYKSSDLIL